jgi:hypothetical protein
MPTLGSLGLLGSFDFVVFLRVGNPPANSPLAGFAVLSLDALADMSGLDLSTVWTFFSFAPL